MSRQKTVNKAKSTTVALDILKVEIGHRVSKPPCLDMMSRRTTTHASKKHRFSSVCDRLMCVGLRRDVMLNMANIVQSLLLGSLGTLGRAWRVRTTGSDCQFVRKRESLLSYVIMLFERPQTSLDTFLNVAFAFARPERVVIFLLIVRIACDLSSVLQCFS